jgi:hypothetical protein
MSSRSLQTYLAVIDPLLFPVLKTIRRAFTGLSWAITGDIAAYLYAYSSSLPAANLHNPELHLIVRDLTRLDAALQQLYQQGFAEEDQNASHLCLHYPLLSTRIKISFSSQPLNVVWMRNRKGKSTYPLLQIGEVIKQKEKEINSLSKVERMSEWETYNWMKDVANHVIIE